MRDPFENVPGIGEARVAIMERALDYWRAATPRRRAQGSGWYAMAKAYAGTLAREVGCSVERAADVLAITSINQTWKGNQTLATKHLKTGWIGGLPAVRAQLAAGKPNGRKVVNFAKAIAGDESAVVVDRWLYRAFGASPSSRAYDVIEAGITDAANLLGIAPRTLQATIWTIVRGRAE